MDIHRIYRSIFSVFRKRRIRLFYRTFSVSAQTRVLDLGGSIYFWSLAVRLGLPLPKLTIFNLEVPAHDGAINAEWVAGDARQMPFVAGSFDLVFCNSVIEHVGTWEDQVQMASEIHRVAKRYFVQTPDRRFPMEPHLLTPFIHWLPQSLRGRLIPRFTLREMLSRMSPGEAEDFRRVRLLDKSNLAALFPDANIVHERFMGLSKSLIAIRQ